MQLTVIASTLSFLVALSSASPLHDIPTSLQIAQRSPEGNDDPGLDKSKPCGYMVNKYQDESKQTPLWIDQEPICPNVRIVTNKAFSEPPEYFKIQQRCWCWFYMDEPNYCKESNLVAAGAYGDWLHTRDWTSLFTRLNIHAKMALFECEATTCDPPIEWSYRCGAGDLPKGWWDTPW